MILKAATLQTGRQNHSHRKLFKVSPLLYETRPLGCWHPGDPCFPEDRTFITCTNKVLSPAQAPMRFELMISCLRDRRFNQLSHGARYFQGLVKFSKTIRYGDIVEKHVKVPPRFELGSLDSESKVLTITPWNLLAETRFST